MISVSEIATLLFLLLNNLIQIAIKKQKLNIQKSERRKRTNLFIMAGGRRFDGGRRLGAGPAMQQGED